MNEIIYDSKIGFVSLWSVFSSINFHMLMNHKVNCNDWKGMNNLMKNVTKWYVPKDSLIITLDQFKDLITNKLNPMKDPFDRITVVFISLMYYRYISQG